MAEDTVVTLFGSAVPAATDASVADGTLVTSLITLAGQGGARRRGRNSALLAEAGFCVVLTTMKATTMTMTPRMLPPVNSIRLRISRLR